MEVVISSETLIHSPNVHRRDTKEDQTVLPACAHMVEPGIEPGTSCLVVRSSDHQATRLVISPKLRNKIMALNIVRTDTGTLRFTPAVKD